MKIIQLPLRLFLCFGLVLCLLPASAQKKVRGNGEVVKENRNLDAFHSIKVEDGVDVYIEQGDATAVVVKADENLVELIKTEVSGNTLKIYSKGSIYRAKAFDVYVTVKDLKQIHAHDGSDVYTLNEIQADVLELTMRGGSDLEMQLVANTVECNLSGGSDAKLKGEVKHLMAYARGGSDLEAKRLLTDKCEVEVHGGSDAWVHAHEEMDARAFGGSDIYYSGNPKVVHQKAKGSSDIHSN